MRNNRSSHRIFPPRLTVVKGEVHWGRRLDEFRLKYSLSIRDLEKVVDGGLKRSALNSLLSGKSNPKWKPTKHLIADKLRFYLKTKHQQTSLEIEKQLLDIFHEPICSKEEPVLTQRAMLSRAAQAHFGLRFDPFSVDPRNRSEVFTTKKLDRIVDKLEDAIRYQHFVGVIGEIGAGKSLLKRRVMQSCIDSKGKMELLWPEFMNMERVHSGSIASYILRKFGQRAPRDLVQRAGNLKEMLGSMANDGIRVALGFDECHRLDPRLLTALKNFWELGSGGYDRYLGLVLFGQPRFEMTLRNAEFREIAERLEIIYLPSLYDRQRPRDSVAWDYVVHRMRIAGGNAEKIFERPAIEKLAEYGPTPLALGNLANAAMLKAFELNEKKVTKALVASRVLDSVNGGDPQVRSMTARRS